MRKTPVRQPVIQSFSSKVAHNTNVGWERHLLGKDKKIILQYGCKLWKWKKLHWFEFHCVYIEMERVEEGGGVDIGWLGIRQGTIIFQYHNSLLLLLVVYTHTENNCLIFFLQVSFSSTTLSTIPYCFYSVHPYWKTIVLFSARVHYKNSKELWNDL